MITFPTTTEAFIADQEAGAGRKLHGLERDIAAEIVVRDRKFVLEEGADIVCHAHSIFWKGLPE